MAKVLYITANPKPEQYSATLTVSREFLTAYKTANPKDEVKEINLYQTQYPLLDQDVMNAWGKLMQGADFNTLSDPEKKKLGAIDQNVNEFIEAKKYIFAAPMWNFSFPPMLKVYIDNIIIMGKTFKYSEQGPVGLLGGMGKKAVIIMSSGGIFSQGPYAAFNHATNYLKDVLNFIGVESVEAIYAEGTNMYPDKIEQIKADAIQKAKTLAKKF